LGRSRPRQTLRNVVIRSESRTSTPFPSPSPSPRHPREGGDLHGQRPPPQQRATPKDARLRGHDGWREENTAPRSVIPAQAGTSMDSAHRRNSAPPPKGPAVAGRARGRGADARAQHASLWSHNRIKSGA
jgi:hypothetical protein